MSKKRKKHNEIFPHKTLLIFSGACCGIALIFLYVLGNALKLIGISEYNIYSFLISIVPLAKHIYLWGNFCEWKNIRVWPLILKGIAILYAIAVIICFFGYLVQKYA